LWKVRVENKAEGEKERPFHSPIISGEEQEGTMGIGEISATTELHRKRGGTGESNLKDILWLGKRRECSQRGGGKGVPKAI